MYRLNLNKIPSGSRLLLAPSKGLASRFKKSSQELRYLATATNSESQTSRSSTQEPEGGQFTVSKSEIEHFNKLASTWWNEHGAFGLLHRMNPVRVQFIKERLLYDLSRPDSGSGAGSRLEERQSDADSYDFLAGKRVLDVGCGGGIFSEVLARLGAQVLAIDAAEDSIKAARLHAQSDPLLNDLLSSPNPNLLYRHCSVESLLQPDNLNHHAQYDIVCAMEVIEHVENPAGFLTALAELTKPGGQIILSTISRTPLSRLLTITLAESNLPIVGIVPPGTHTYNKFIKPDELTEFFRGQLGWATSHERSDLEVRGCTYDPLASRWKLFPRDAFWAEWCNYFFGVKKPL
ncbi:Hexaprenyldihydroxybenzoate methyltransferase, mitochondrial [Puccinia graminis f. sp. tritici]|uniref:Ubiquinone biosynthesis O-methyltransferase, mitochondrial n=1 Tax=Puccinia graminis f. sp. tritici TaxID=56615 RepID=A0A5B0RM91_PUCGR|nr:Hexaprenyldihydroxybenzoate methyltransferase, mitochondrial [Puccinia graminis f. sp. tritici]